MSPAPAPSNADLDGRALAHFQVETKIGEGGMGIVYRAIDTRNDRTVALKVLAPRYVQDGSRRRRLLREARLAAAVEHPNVAAVYEVAEADGQVLIAMELVRGDTLRVLIDRSKLSVLDAVSFALAIARGVGRAHEKGVVHRDLKPENIVVTWARDVKVLDFGLAKLHEGHGSLVYEEETVSNVTLEGKVTGTPGYMAPEQVTGKEVSFRADVFSIGVILYEMLAGKHPFCGDSVMDVLIASTRDEPSPLRAANPSVPAAVERIVSRCLAKRPADRFASAGEIVRALEALDGLPEPAFAPLAARPTRLKRFARAVIPTAAGFAITSIALGLYLKRPAPMPTPVAVETAIAHVSPTPIDARALAPTTASAPAPSAVEPVSFASATASPAPPTPTAHAEAVPRVAPRDVSITPRPKTHASPATSSLAGTTPSPLERGTQDVPIIE